MDLKTFIPTALIGLSTLAPAFVQKKTGIINKNAPKLELNSKFNAIVNDTFSKRISDETKIIAYNKLLKQYNRPVSNYIVVDKKHCQAKVYTPDGHVIFKTEIAAGRDIGDLRGGGFMVPGAELRAYTTPGEFMIAREGSKNAKNIRLYGKRIFMLAGDHTQAAYKNRQVLAIHQVPATPMGRLRKNVFNNGSTKDNRVSYGCVNLLPETFDKLKTFVKGVGTKVYILPEEKGNSLALMKQKDGRYKFVQTKYQFESQEPKHVKKVMPDKTDKQPADTVKNDTLKSDSIAAKDSVKTTLPKINPIDIKNVKISQQISDDRPKLDSIKLNK